MSTTSRKASFDPANTARQLSQGAIYESCALSNPTCLHFRFVFGGASGRTNRQEDRFAHGGDRWREVALYDGRSRTDGHIAARFRRNFADVETDYAAVGGEVFRDRAGPAGHRRLFDSSGQDRHENVRESYSCARPIARRRESESRRTRYRFDGGVRIRDAVPGGNGKACGNGCISSRRARMGSHLQRSEWLALSF